MFAGYAFQRFRFELQVSHREKKKIQRSCSSIKWSQPPRFSRPLCSPRTGSKEPSWRRARKAGARDSQPGCRLPRARLQRVPPPRAPPRQQVPGSTSTAPLGRATAPGKKGAPAGARTSRSDKDRGFMINSGRFKYLLSQGFWEGEGHPSQSQSCHRADKWPRQD